MLEAAGSRPAGHLAQVRAAERAHFACARSRRTSPSIDPTPSIDLLIGPAPRIFTVSSVSSEDTTSSLHPFFTPPDLRTIPYIIPIIVGEADSFVVDGAAGWNYRCIPIIHVRLGSIVAHQHSRAVDYRSMDVAFGGEFGFGIRSFWLLFGESSFFKSVVRLSAPGSKAALDRCARRETAC